MNKKTLVTAVASVIAFILLTINTIFNTDLQIPAEVVESLAVLIATGIMWFISHYYNQDYSAIANKMTPIMRKIKKLEKEGDLTLIDAIENLIDEWSEDNDSEQ